MKWEAVITTPKYLRCVIEHEQFTNIIDNTPLEGFYLYVYDKDEKNTHDYLQDTFQFAVEQASEDFGVPETAWRRIE
ncbi:MAG: hypothetical protein H6908_06495 [Hyphomicrobiales bacterium]|nr:hypothetical protein [Hyphomicrobiales bacterium]